MMDPHILSVIDKQLDIIGEKEVSFRDWEDDPLIKVTIKKKEVERPWYEHYLFESEEQYIEWKEWARTQVSDEDMLEIDLLYSLNWKMKRES